VNWLQIDEVPQAMLCDPSIREQTRALGEDPDRLTAQYIAAVNRIIARRPTAMTLGMHLCRGNLRSRWLAASGYEAVAERLFNECAVDGFFLEYDRGTMNRRDYFRKFAAYYDYAITRRFEWDYHGYPTILVVTSSNTAEERIASVVRHMANGRNLDLPLLLTTRWRVDHPSNRLGFLGPIWRAPDATRSDDIWTHRNATSS